MAVKKPVFQIVYDEERVTVGDVIDLEEAETVKLQIEILGRHVKNGKGEYLEPDLGYAALRSLTISQINEHVTLFQEAAAGADDPN